MEKKIAKKITLIVVPLLLVIQHANGATENPLIINKAEKTITAEDGTNYKWFYNGIELEGVISNKIKVLKDGVYSVEITNADGETDFAQIKYSTNESTPHKIFVIGDSTASNYSDSYYPRNGWAQVLQAFFDTDSIIVIDKALSGRSSKNYYTDPDGWPTVVNEIREEDYLFIQFGHNDQKDDERYTDPYTTYQDYLSIYIDSARAKGAYPVLLTSIHRNNWSGSTIYDTHGDYPPAMRALATEKDVPLIDLHLKTKSLFESLGVDYTTNQIFMNLPAGIWINYVSGNEDNTHLQENGAYEVCKLVENGISELSGRSEMTVLNNALVPVGRLIVMPNPDLSGEITGNGVYAIGSEIVLSASARNGYIFSNWTEEDSLISDTSSITIVLNDSVRTLSANFSVAYEVELKQTPAFAGKIRGYGYYAPGSEVTIIATPFDGNRFLYWQRDDQIVTTDSIYTFTMGEEDVSFRAFFEEIPVSINNYNKTEESVHIYPNPASDFLMIESERKILQVELFSITGTKIFETSYNNHSINLNVAEHAHSGFFLLRITTESGQSVIKLEML